MHHTLPATKGQVAHAFFQVPICHVERRRDIRTAVDFSFPDSQIPPRGSALVGMTEGRFRPKHAGSSE